MNGLDPEAVRDMRELLKRLRDERGMTVVVSSHILAEVELLCDWVIIVRNGRVICDAGVSELISRGDRVPGGAGARHGHRAGRRRTGTVRPHPTRAAGPRGTDELRIPARRPHLHAPEVLRLLTAQDVYPRELLGGRLPGGHLRRGAVRAAEAAAEDGPFEHR